MHIKGERTIKFIKYILLIAFSVLILFPLFYCISSSFKTNIEIMSMPEMILPKKPTFENYIAVFNSESFHAARMLFNSMWYTCASVFITLFLSTITGYVFARGEFKGKQAIFVIFSSLMFISMGSITIYPLIEILANLKLTNSLYGLLFMQCFGIPVVNMYLVRGFINGLPKEIDEAAEVDGCSFIGILFRIITPMLKPVLITIGILAFNNSWNSYLMPALFTMNNPEQQTLIVGIMELKNSGEAASSWNLMLAASVLAILPVIIIYIIGNRNITDGIAAGAVKG